MSRFADRLARLLGVDPDSRVRRLERQLREARGAHCLLEQEAAGVRTELAIALRRLDDTQQRRAAAEQAADRLAELLRAEYVRLDRIGTVAHEDGSLSGARLVRIQALLGDGEDAGA